MAYRNYATAVSHIVDPTGLGDFTTLQSAINAASAGNTIFIRPGTYSLTAISGGINLNITAFPTDSNPGDAGTAGVVIIQGLDISQAGIINISGVTLQTNSTSALAVTGSSATVVNLFDCNINATNSTGISFTTSNTSASLNLTNCNGNLAATGIKFFNMTSTGAMAMFYSYFANTSNSTTASTISAGVLNSLSTTFIFPITSSGTGTIGTSFSQHDTAGQNVTALTIGGSGDGLSFYSTFASGTAAVLSIGTAYNLINPSITSSATNTITGAGTLTYSGINYNTGSTNGMNVTTISRSVFDGGYYKGNNSGGANSAGMIGEQIRSYVGSGTPISLSTTAAANITSIALTPGIWDVSAMGAFITAATTVPTKFQISISANSATVAGMVGDSDALLNLSTAASLGTGYQPTLAVPSFRVTISANTTYFLVALANFTVSTLTAYGRLSASRVG